MDWSDESYVKLYTRDTVTWRSWPWQAKAVWPSLMKKLDGAGLMPCGRLEMARAVAVMIEFPVEVVAVGLEALLADGTIEQVAGGLLAPKFIEAQEARKNDRLRAAEYRSRSRAIAKTAKPQDPPVTPRHTASRNVTGRHSPALPSPAPPRPKSLRAEKPPAVPKAVDSRHGPLIKALVEAGCDFNGGRDAKQVTLLLAKGEPAEVVARWRRALAWPLPFPRVRTLTELVAMWPHFAADAPTKGIRPADPNQTFPTGELHASPV